MTPGAVVILATTPIEVRLPRRPGRIAGPILVLALGVTSAIAPGASVRAAGAGGATWTPARSRTVLVTSGFRTMRSAVYAMVSLRWSPATLRGLRAYTAQGLGFTLEVNDLAGRLSATGAWIADLPGAAYDRDDDDGDGRWEEVEVTAADSASIEARRTYHVGLQLARWYRACGATGCGWRWEHRAGRVATLGQLSAWFLGEWQAQRWTTPWIVQPVARRARPGPRAAGAPSGSPTAAAVVVFAGRWHGRRARCGVPAAAPDPALVCHRLGLRAIRIDTGTYPGTAPAIRPPVIIEQEHERPWAASIR